MNIYKYINSKAFNKKITITQCGIITSAILFSVYLGFTLLILFTYIVTDVNLVNLIPAAVIMAAISYVTGLILIKG